MIKRGWWLLSVGRASLSPPARFYSGTVAPLLIGEGDSENCGEEKTVVELLSWGRGSCGQLGGGVEETRLYPTAVALLRLSPRFCLSKISGCLPTTPETSAQVGISCGLFHSSLLIDGRVWVWGKGDGGRLGLGNENWTFTPVVNPYLESISSVALGGLHSCALTSDGEVLTWGYGGFGALGHSVYHRELVPRLVEHDWGGKIINLATSGTHTAAISETGELFTWGRDEGEGRLGLGSGGAPDEGALGTPTKVEALPVPIATVACGGFFTMALTADGQLWSWGGNSNFELGRGDRVSDWRPQPIPSLEGIKVIQIACGGYHSAALTSEGKVLTWGHGRQGQLGHGTKQNTEIPREVEELVGERVVYVACGSSSSAAITDEGKLYMWGNAKDCQLGIPGLPEIQPYPLEVKFLVDEGSNSPHVLAVAIGATHAMCLVRTMPRT